MSKIEKIAVLGSGTMGGGIAQMFAEKGFEVLLWDISPEASSKGLGLIRKRLSGSVEKGKMSPADAETISGKIRTVENFGGLSDCGLVIEALIEDFDKKLAIFRKLEELLPADTVIGSNTSSLSITGLAAELKNPGRFLGIHFFNPPTKLDLVELVLGPESDESLLPDVEELLSACGKTLVKVKDSPGFIVNRLLLPLINDAARLVGEGVASAEDIDTAMKLGALHPAGPLQVADLIGLDVCRHILDTLAESLDNPHFRPAEAIVELVEAGKLGRKSGEGFYKY